MVRPLKKVAITGGLSSGKSTVCRLFRQLGAYTLSADDLVHHLLLTDRTIIRKVVSLFGKEILAGSNIDRAKVAEKAFRSPEKLNALEVLLHPRVYGEIERHYNEVRGKERSSLFVVEVPLLYESEGERWFDCCVVVAAPDSVCRERYGKEKEYAARTARQWPIEKKAALADIVLENNGELVALERAVVALYEVLSS